MECYGCREQDGYPLAAWIWGHRLRIGQHWMEYLLEFLNVLAGFDYELGQGVTEGVTEPCSKMEYIRFTRLGLRRFVFYDEWEKTRHPFDDRAHHLLQEALEEHVDVYTGGNGQDPLALARSLLRAFSAVEEQRSWYAKSLFPAHHNLLFWEALRKGATKYRGLAVPPDTPPRMLDAEIAFDARNFFARGGEIYYLILSAGTQDNPARRQAIADCLQDLLTLRNYALGQLAEIIDQTWQYEAAEGVPARGQGSHDKRGRVGWIPDPDCALYNVIAEDVEVLLQAELDPLEILYLLSHLVGFHLTLYIYHHAHPEANSDRHADGSCLDACRPILLVDALEGADGGIIRDVSAGLFRGLEARIAQKGREYVSWRVQMWGNACTDVRETVSMLDSEAQAHFHLGGLSKRSRGAFERRVNALLEKVNSGTLDRDAFMAAYAEALTDLLMRDFHKNFLGVHRKLSKSIGLVMPRRGPSARFVLGDNLLKALRMANLSPGTSMTYDEFLARLYQRYGLVVGPVEVRRSGLLDRQWINSEYYHRNKSALLEKMKHAGLATGYSDATALVGG